MQLLHPQNNPHIQPIMPSAYKCRKLTGWGRTSAACAKRLTKRARNWGVLVLVFFLPPSFWLSLYGTLLDSRPSFLEEACSCQCFILDKMVTMYYLSEPLLICICIVAIAAAVIRSLLSKTRRERPWNGFPLVSVKGETPQRSFALYGRETLAKGLQEVIMCKAHK